MSYTQQLYQLQQIDSQMDAAKKRILEISASLVETPALKEARASFEQAQTNYNKIKATTTDLELEVKGLQQKTAEHEKRLYSGKVISPKEAAALQEEIASTKRWLAKKEEDLLESMINLEEAEETLEACQKALAEVQAQWEADQSELIEEKKRKQSELVDLNNSRPAITQFIDPDELKQYEVLRKAKRGIGVAPIKDGTCRACGVTLSSRIIQQASNDDQLYFCESCKRIIHIV